MLQWSIKFSNNDIQHHGIEGQKWGNRRWQNKDGSLTPEGYVHYYGESKKRYAKALQKKKDIKRDLFINKVQMPGIALSKKSKNKKEKMKEKRSQLKQELKATKKEIKQSRKEYKKSLSHYKEMINSIQNDKTISPDNKRSKINDIIADRAALNYENASTTYLIGAGAGIIGGLLTSSANKSIQNYYNGGYANAYVNAGKLITGKILKSAGSAAVSIGVTGRATAGADAFMKQMQNNANYNSGKYSNRK